MPVRGAAATPTVPARPPRSSSPCGATDVGSKGALLGLGAGVCCGGGCGGVSAGSWASRQYRLGSQESGPSGGARGGAAVHAGSTDLGGSLNQLLGRSGPFRQPAPAAEDDAGREQSGRAWPRPSRTSNAPPGNRPGIGSPRPQQRELLAPARPGTSSDRTTERLRQQSAAATRRVSGPGPRARGRPERATERLRPPAPTDASLPQRLPRVSRARRAAGPVPAARVRGATRVGFSALGRAAVPLRGQGQAPAGWAGACGGLGPCGVVPRGGGVAQ